MWEAPPLHKLQEAIESPSYPIGMRMRAAYFLRQAYETAVRNRQDDDNDEDNNNIKEVRKEKEPQHGTTEEQTVDGEQTEKELQPHRLNDEKSSTVEEIVIATLEKGLMDERHGSLLRHEFAYVMGQLRDERCCESLEKTLSNTSDCIMVRHECGEALGAIGAPRSIPILEEALRLSPNTPEIGQTCEIAIAYMKWKTRRSQSSTNNNNNNKQYEEEEAPMVCACMASPYSSIDPAPPHPSHISLPTSQIASILLDQTLPLFERYRAMFSLRNRGGRDAVLALGSALVSDTSSALLRHEVAYVLGQMQDDHSVEALGESLRRVGEHAMVRHESAEALGAIEGRWEEVVVILKEFCEDEDDVVRDSCLVALDAADYWGRVNDGGDIGVGVSVGDGGGSVEAKGNGEMDVPISVDVYRDGDDDALLTPMTFVHQKAVTNGKINPVLNHHFNVAC